jgi:sigma-E factor negative regulatory protein RseA
MSEYLRDQLSAFIDGELPKHEIELLFKRLDGNAELRATLARYTLIGESLRTRSAEGPSRTFAERVRAAVRESGPLVGGVTSAARMQEWRWLKPVAGMAVAATVAAVAILGLQRMQDPLIESPQVAATVPAQPVIPEEATAGAAGSPSYVVPAPASANSLVNTSRLTNYVVAHSEYSSPLGRRSVLSGIVAEGAATPDTIAESSDEDAEARTPAETNAEPRQ